VRVLACTIAKALLLLGLVLFHVHNFLAYDPTWGYDGRAHTLLVQLYSQSVDFNPLTAYGGTNPPLYYVLAGKILEGTGSLKAVQAFSLLVFAATLAALWVTLRAVCPHSPLRWPIFAFFALNPLHLAYGYMVFNYALAQAMAVAFVCILLILAVRDDRPLPRFLAPGLGLWAAAGVWTALTNLALLPIGAAFLYFRPSASRRTRLVTTAVFLAVSLAVIAPFAAVRNLEQNCFLCTANRPVSSRPFYESYPAHYYFWVSLRPFHHPHVPYFWKDGMWPVVYQTYFSDYFNYIVGPRYALAGTEPTSIKVGPHTTDVRRDDALTLLNYLGLPLAAAMLAAFAVSVRTAWRFVRDRRPDRFADVIVCVASIVYLAQFLAYIHRYPDYVNIHAGYLFPITASLWLQVARRLAPGPGMGMVTGSLAVALTLYCAVAVGTFFLW